MINGLIGYNSNSNYEKAKMKLKNIKERFDGFCIAFPDITPNEIMFIQNKWETLPSSLGKGVKIMALSFSDGIRTFITDFSPNAYIKPHKHMVYEYGRVINGELINRLNGDVYKAGDEFRFIPNELHYMVSSKEGSTVYSVLTEKSDHKINDLYINSSSDL